ncbi:O-antigen polymerase [Acinetobacter higginsii]|uniref:O-antigen polymerase n=1 Tax=Acinetobacter higginsii TaxID=70347 RepID=UPI001F4AC2E1|nr:O-antigen polymerase [Acinetobacter higginsii]MCH7340648.1 oligosaccharide repeat unit polymerase [Acinetobacter higginsii]
MEYLIAFLIFSIALFFPLLIFSRKHFGSVLELNYFNIWFGLYFILAWIGALLTLLGFAKDSYFISGILHKVDVVGVGSLAVLWSGIGMFYSFIFTLLLLDRGLKSKWNNVIQRNIFDHKNEKIIIYLFSIFTFLSFVYYQVKIFPSPFIMALQGDPIGAAVKRIDITKDLSKYANTYLIAFGMLLSQLLSIQMIIRGQKEKFLKYFMLCVAILFLLSSGEKGPAIFFLIGLFVAYGISKKSIKKVNLKFGIITFLSLFLIYYFVVTNDINEIKELIFERLLFAQMSIVYYSFDYYHVGNFIGFESLGGIFNKILNLEVVPPSSEVLMQQYFSEMLLNGGWNINGIYISEAWSNFGVLGVIFAPLYVGLINALLYLFLSNKNSSFYSAILVYYTACSFGFLTSFNLYLYNTITVLVLILVMIHYFFIKMVGK